jgi:peptidoglycan/xylan/chitin deacetylase (PgdA/CDA1 family)
LPRLTLTFDNGPDPTTTPQVLGCLGERQLPATFFVVGTQLRRPGCRPILEDAVAAGHWVGNHSMTHAVPLGEDRSPVAVDEEIVAMERLLGDLGAPEMLFRPFGGGGVIGPHLLSRSAADYLAGSGYTVVLWNCVPRDWEEPVEWPRRARETVLGGDWTVLVLHDLPTGAMDQLGGFLDEMLAAGVDIVQEFPADCLPIRRGTVQHDLSLLMTSDVGGQTLN